MVAPPGAWCAWAPPPPSLWWESTHLNRQQASTRECCGAVELREGLGGQVRMEHGGGGAAPVAARRLWQLGRRTGHCHWQALNRARLPSWAVLPVCSEHLCSPCSPFVPSAAGTALPLTPPASAWSPQVRPEEARAAVWLWWCDVIFGWGAGASHPCTCHKYLPTPHTKPLPCCTCPCLQTIWS